MSVDGKAEKSKSIGIRLLFIVGLILLFSYAVIFFGNRFIVQELVSDIVAGQQYTISSLFLQQSQTAVRLSQDKPIQTAFDRIAKKQFSLDAAFFYDVEGSLKFSFLQEGFTYNKDAFVNLAGLEGYLKTSDIKSRQEITLDYNKKTYIGLPMTYQKRDGEEVSLGYMLSVWNHNQIDNLNVQATAMAIPVAVVCLVIMLVIVAFILKRELINPLNSLSTTTNNIVSGELPDHVPFQNRQDEIGILSRAMEMFRQNQMKVKEFTDRLEAEKDAQKKKVSLLNNEADLFYEQAERITDSISNASGFLDDTARNLSKIVENNKLQNDELSKSSSSMRINIETVAGATTELDSSIASIANQIHESNTMAKQGVDVVNEADGTIKGLSTAADDIKQVVSIINDIAEQTNLLALNATIEAARAGEAGKGFAVVAGEVKSLASQTSAATSDIERKIMDVQAVSSEAAKALENVRVIVEKMSEISESISYAVQEQLAVTKEISNNMEKNTGEISSVTEKIDESYRETTKTKEGAESVLNASQELAKYADDMAQEVSRFIQQLSEIQQS